jgi:hypothetical protein
MAEYRYFQFPLMLLKDLHLDYARAMEEIITFSIVDYALKQKVRETDAAKQALYNFYRGGGLIKVRDRIDDYMRSEEISYDEDYEGFTGTGETFDPDIEEVLEIFEKDNNFKTLAKQNFQLNTINNFFGIKGPDNDARLKKYQEIKEKVNKHEEKFGKDPMPTVEKNLFLDFKEKENEPILFSAYMAIRSLEGPKYFTETTKKVILMRMLGAKSKKALEEHLETKEINDIHHKFTRSSNALRHHFDKLRNRLLKRGLVKAKIYERSISRKIFLSTRLNHDQLADKIIEAKQRKNHKKKEKEAIQKIRNANT